MKPFVLFLMTASFSITAFAGVSGERPLHHSYNLQTADTRPGVQVHSPRTKEQAAKIIGEAVAAGKKIRPSGRRHSTSGITLSDDAVYIRSDNMKTIGPIEERNGEYFVTVQAGVTLHDLSYHLADKGYSLGFAFPVFGGLSMIGLVSTGSHGSSTEHAAISAQTVESIKVITADKKEVIFTRNNPEEFKAATVSLGRIGFAHEATFKIQPQFNIGMETQYVHDAKADLFSTEGKINWLGPNSDLNKEKPDFFSIVWFPNAGKAVRYVGKKTSEPATPGGENVNFGLDDGFNAGSYAAEAALKITRENADFGVQFEDLRFKRLEAAAPFVKLVDGLDVSSTYVVGPSHKMLLARETDDLRWLYGVNDYSFGFPESEAHAVLKTIDEFAKKRKYGFPLTGISMRFAKSDGTSSYLSHAERPGGKPELFVFAEFIEYRPLSLEQQPETDLDRIRNDLIRLLIRKHKVSFHLGKNEDWILEKGSKVYGDNLKMQNQVVAKYDPKGTFSSETVNRIMRVNQCVTYYE